MNPQVARARPWRPEDTRLALAGRVQVTLRAGEDPAHVPSHRDVRTGTLPSAGTTRVGALDRALRRFSPAVRVERVHCAATALGSPGRRHVGFDDLEVDTGLSRTFRVDLDADADVAAVADALASLPMVESASPWYLSETPFEAGDAGAEVDTSRELVGAAEALAMEPGDSAVIVGVVDSGVALDHPEFVGRMRPGYDGVDLPPDRASSRLRFVGDTRGRDRDASDHHGHGTACMGILGARGVGVERGLAGAAQMLPLRGLAAARAIGRASLTAVGSLGDLDACVKMAIDLGARVLNLSFGTPASALRRTDPLPHVAVVRYALARGCLLVAASGNDGRWTAYYPAVLPGVIAVGAVTPGARPTVFTSRGPHVALSAPGAGVRAPSLQGGYAPMTGTSFAAPFVTAACALLLARAARHSVPASPATVRDLLVRSARPWGSGVEAEGCGAGLLDVPAALRRADEVFREMTDDEGRVVESGPAIPARPAALHASA